MVRGLQLACSDEDLDEPMDAEPGLKGCSAVNPLATQIDVQTTPLILLTSAPPFFRCSGDSAAISAEGVQIRAAGDP